MTDFDFTVKRSARRTISLRIVDGGTLEVRCPLKTSQSYIDAFVNSKRAWIERTIAKEEQKKKLLEGVLDYKFVLVKGERVPLTLGGRTAFSYDGVTVGRLKDLGAVYKKWLGDEFIALFLSIAEKYGFGFSEVKIRDYKSRWGCCDRSKRIAFSYKLLMLPQIYWEYVIVHELCHTVCMDHSPKFYALVSKIFPQYKRVVKQLKNFAPLTRLY